MADPIYSELIELVQDVALGNSEYDTLSEKAEQLLARIPESRAPELPARESTLEGDEMVSYREAKIVCRDLNEGDGSDNPEYARGQVELIADLWGRPGVFLADRKVEVADELGLKL